MNKEQLSKANELQKAIDAKEKDVKHLENCLTAYKEGAKSDRGELRYFYKNGCGEWSFKLESGSPEDALKKEIAWTKAELKKLEGEFAKL